MMTKLVNRWGRSFVERVGVFFLLAHTPRRAFPLSLIISCPAAASVVEVFPRGRAPFLKIKKWKSQFFSS